MKKEMESEDPEEEPTTSSKPPEEPTAPVTSSTEKVRKSLEFESSFVTLRRHDVTLVKYVYYGLDFAN